MSAVRSGGEHSRGAEPEDQNAARMRPVARQAVVRSLMFVRALPLVGKLAWRDEPDPAAAHPAPPPGRLAGHAGRAPGARLLITLRISRV
ncbi:hypothetical protein [Actinomadura hibisca]|uniref:hypothetical protein n=1 Tax=Actinomadura hibisca TaxID=68565 RepID=UPI0012F7C8D3|nr:hypothetical protein [Actinomadura hibisca]